MALVRKIKTMPHDKFVKLLRAQVQCMKRKHTYLETQLERHSRYAPPQASNKIYWKLEREMVKLEKQMTIIEQIVRKFPDDCKSYVF